MDHEASGAQEWMLPGYGQERRQSPDRVTSNQPGRSAPQAPAKDDTATMLPTPNILPRGASRGSRGRGVSHVARGRINPINNSSSRLFRDSPAKAKWRAGAPPTGTVKLHAQFGSFKRELIGIAKVTATGRSNKSHQEVFEDISRKTGVYIRNPAYTDQVIHLWGEPAQVASAKDMLQELLSKCSPAPQKKKIEWAKIYAHNADKEAGADCEERRESIMQELRKEPESAAAYPEKLLFLWPGEGPSITESLGRNLEALDILRAKFGYVIYVPKDLPDYICVLGDDNDVMRHIGWRLRTKWSEAIANSSIKSKVYVIEPPEPSVMKKRVIVKKEAYLTRASLHGDSLTESESAYWVDRAKVIRFKNNARILAAIDKSLQGVSLVRGHLRMRVNFGTFILDLYRRPKDDNPSYSFGEFREMMFHEHSKGRLIPGLEAAHNPLGRCFKAADLLERYERKSTALEKAEPAFSVNFEFLGKTSGLLRLEAEFEKCTGAQEYEVSQRRWLKVAQNAQSFDSRPPLQIGVMDFSRCDWQFEIKSLEFHEARSIDAALMTFSHSIGFRCTTDIGILTAKPKRKVIFPDSAPVARFIEKMAVRYRVKGTKYVLEVARYDEYRRAAGPGRPTQDPSKIHVPMSDIPFTSWGASLFNSNWDNLLGQHANLPVGGATRYAPSLGTFFPNSDTDTSDKSSSFSEFIELVRRVAELLGSGRAVGTVPSSKSSGTSTPSIAESEKSANSKHSAGREKKRDRMIDGDLGTLF